MSRPSRQKWLTPRLADLHARHPDIDFRIHASSEMVDFARTDFHVAIRLGTGTYPGLRCEKILDEYLVAVASPAVLAKHGTIAAAAGGIASLPLLHGTEIDWNSWCAGDVDGLTRLRGAFLDDSAALLSATVEGLGFGILRWTLAGNSGRTARVGQQTGAAVSLRLLFRVSRGLHDLAQDRRAAGLAGDTGAEFPSPPGCSVRNVSCSCCGDEQYKSDGIHGRAAMRTESRFDTDLARETVALILAGGNGTRLGELTRWQCKPAIPFAGSFCNIDFHLVELWSIRACGGLPG